MPEFDNYKHPFLYLRKPVFPGTERVMQKSHLKEESKKKIVEHFLRIYQESRQSLPIQPLLDRRDAYLSFCQKEGFLIISIIAKLEDDLTGGFLPGLADSGAIENVGLSHDHLSGIPMLPASGFKGVLHHHALQSADEFLTADERDWIFGKAAGKNNEGSAGNAIFLDAIPIEPPELALDGLTPHYPIEYDETNPPADWQSPTPISFLTIKDAKLRFDILLDPSRPLVNEGSTDPKHIGELLPKLKEILDDCFEFSSFGAKGSSGYGFFQRDTVGEKKSKAIEEQRERDKKKQIEKQHLQSLSLAERLKYESENHFAKAFTEQDYDYTIKTYFQPCTEMDDSQEKLELSINLKSLWEAVDKWTVKKPKKQAKKCVNLVEIIKRLEG
jgi:CRISPR-associated protein Cmr6